MDGISKTIEITNSFNVNFARIVYFICSFFCIYHFSLNPLLFSILITYFVAVILFIYELSFTINDESIVTLKKRLLIFLNTKHIYGLKDIKIIYSKRNFKGNTIDIFFYFFFEILLSGIFVRYKEIIVRFNNNTEKRIYIRSSLDLESFVSELNNKISLARNKE